MTSLIAFKEKPKREALEEVLDYMDKHFKEGDLLKTAQMATEWAKQQKLVSGPLWDEVGCRVLKDAYRMQRLIPDRNKIKNVGGRRGHYSHESHGSLAPSTPKKIDKNIGSGGGHDNCETHSVPAPTSPRSLMYYIEGRYYDLMNLTKNEVKKIASHYDKLAKTNGFERDFLLKVANKLKGKQVVKDVFDIDSLRELRRKVE